MTLTSLTQYARHPGATQSSLLQSARQPASDEKHNTEVEEKKAVPAPKKKRKKKHGITANLSGTRYEVSKYLSSGPFLSVYGAEMPIPPPQMLHVSGLVIICVNHSNLLFSKRIDKKSLACKSTFE